MSSFPPRKHIYVMASKIPNSKKNYTPRWHYLLLTNKLLTRKIIPLPHLTPKTCQINKTRKPTLITNMFNYWTKSSVQTLTRTEPPLLDLAYPPRPHLTINNDSSVAMFSSEPSTSTRTPQTTIANFKASQHVKN